jgi:hypothetical protein
MSSDIKDTDHGYNATLARLAAAAAELTVGIHEAEGSVAKEVPEGEEPPDEPLTVVDVASFHEFGLGVPRRSFIADWFDEKQSEHESQLRKMAQAVVTGKVESVEQGIARLGSLYAAEVQKRISDGIAPGLEDATIKRKTVNGNKGQTPLIETGQMRSAVAPYINGEPIK